jgi:large subunit ribosomal protein L25
MFTIEAKKRTTGDKLDALRKEGEMPAVFYGMGNEATSISISKTQFKKVWRDAGESSAVKISLGTTNVDTLIHDVQVDPVTSEPIHADFLVIDMKKKIQVNVPVEYEGISSAVKSGIGNLVKVLHEVMVEALPADLPHNLVIDISKLAQLNDQVFVSDIKLPKGVTVITDPTEVVASIVAQVEEKEEVAAPVDLSAIEVEKKGKKEEEGEAAATPEKE